MIDGLKLTMSGREVIEWLNEAIERYHAKIRYNRDEIDGKVETPRNGSWAEVPAENVEDEIRQRAHRIRILTIIRDHILPTETYLIGKQDLAFGELLPEPPPPGPELDMSKEIRWVARPFEFERATAGDTGEQA
jgi:hypothetical protein